LCELRKERVIDYDLAAIPLAEVAKHLIGKEIQFKFFLAMKFTTQHDLY